MISRLDVCVICPSKSCLHRSAASLPWVLWGEFPTLLGTIRRLRLLTRHPAALRCLRLAVLCALPSLRPPARHLRVADPGPFVTRRPRRLLRKERMSPPRFLGDPFVYMPCSSTPVGRSDPTHSVRTLLPSALMTASAPHCVFRGSITRPAHPLCTLRRRGRPQPTQHSVPVAGQPYRFGTCTRRVTMKSFSRFVPRYSLLLSQALPGAP